MTRIQFADWLELVWWREYHREAGRLALAGWDWGTAANEASRAADGAVLRQTLRPQVVRHVYVIEPGDLV